MRMFLSKTGTRQQKKDGEIKMMDLNSVVDGDGDSSGTAAPGGEAVGKKGGGAKEPVFSMGGNTLAIPMSMYKESRESLVARLRVTGAIPTPQSSAIVLVWDHLV